jgi:hypothetical protein
MGRSLKCDICLLRYFSRQHDTLALFWNDKKHEEAKAVFEAMLNQVSSRAQPLTSVACRQALTATG